MINIFFIVHNHSGCKTYANELIANLSHNRKLNIIMVYLQISTIYEFTIEKKMGYTEVLIPMTIEKSDDYMYFQRAAQLIYIHFQKFTNPICHINTCDHYLFAIAFKKLFSCQLVFTLHYLENFYYYLDINQLTKQDIKITGNESLGKLIKIADHIICVTEFGKRILIKFYKVSNSKITTIYNGKANPKKFISNERRKRLKQNLGYNADEKILLYAGLLEPRKGIDKLLKSFILVQKHTPYVRLILVGPGDFDYCLPISQKCPGRISFTGKLDKNTLELFYQIADIGIIPSQFEQCSYVAIEMMQYGLPLIISDTPGLNELINHQQTGFLCKVKSKNDGILSLDIDEFDLAEKINMLLENPILASRLAKRAQIECFRKFSLENMGNEVLSIYQRLVLTIN
jgi:glycosyltransferase involved in cell wall biosynthesis